MAFIHQRSGLLQNRPDADLIVPGLYQGSIPPFGYALREAGFDALVLCAQEHQDASKYPGVEVIECPLDDARRFPNPSEWETAREVAWRVRNILCHGGRVLVTCMAGKNRSGLVTALSLHCLTGVSGAVCSWFVKDRRKGAEALTNPYFVLALERVPAWETT